MGSAPTIALCLLAALAAAEDPAGPELELVITPGLRAAALAVPPMSLLADPAAVATVDHVGGQLAAIDSGLVAEAGLPPLLPLLRHLDGAVFQAGPHGAGAGDWFGNGAVLALDAGAAADGLARWMDALFVGSGQRGRWEGFSGYNAGDDIFFGHDGNRFVVGQVGLLAAPVRRLAQLEAAPGEARIAMTWQLRALLATFAAAADGGPALIDDLLGAWRGTSPTARIAIVPAADGWRGSVALTDLGRLPLEPLDGDIAAAARGGWPVTLGLHLDPPTVDRLVSRSGIWPAGDAAPAPADPAGDQGANGGGAVPAAHEPLPLLRHLTGDYLLQAGWTAGGQPPVGALLLRLYDGGEAATDLAAAAATLGATPIRRDGADQAFSLATAWGPVTIARHGERLVVGMADGLMSAWLAGAPGDAPLASGRIVQLDLDLPTIAGRWLPWAWDVLDRVEEPLGDDPLSALDELAWELREGLRHVAQPATVGAMLGGDDPQLTGHEPLRRLFPGADLRGAIDAACAVYVPDPPVAGDDDTPPSARLVLRFADGFALFDGGDRQEELDAPDLAAALQGWKRLAGPDPAALVQLPTPQPAMFDRRWLPPLAAALRHVPAYHLEIASADFSLRADERGLPLAALAAIVGALELWNSPP